LENSQYTCAVFYTIIANFLILMKDFFYTKQSSRFLLQICSTNSCTHSSKHPKVFLASLG